ncbi:nucleotidyltransferase substrate binding protein [Nodosilinea sp. LEGE 07298]|uniref:HI0074 family nucleotidyltransferase substrate-binding subunit n=1 Tax=Nodosilinea sp. LEGE 07298 TaxID=2777970 RepID=UPI00187FE931|nr:HI0074 family nucleotidyltransferase substrate-binding subunit [Nodosilinea sp. LEGE 07298]MBE9110702.1 nucleotidyltransferase substrate binding protein [Nodosilinea sp. LEGE 07298]
MEDPDICWVQRFSNFERTFLLLSKALEFESPSVIERAGLIHFFEMAFELSWNLLEDYEEQEGITAKTPREVIKQAYQAELISRGHDWMNALQDRNLMAHTYSKKTAIAVEAKIRHEYFPLLDELYRLFKTKLEATK